MVNSRRLLGVGFFQDEEVKECKQNFGGETCRKDRECDDNITLERFLEA
jgi:hypothetical protein